MTHIPVKTSFIYPKDIGSRYRFGSGSVQGEILRPDGDWRDFLPPEEYQNINGIESSACYINGQQEAIATLLEEQYDIKDSNFSSRFNVIRSGGTEMGGDPIEGAKSICRDGLVPEILLPFNEMIKSWQEFASFKGSDESICSKTGLEWLKQWYPRYDIVFSENESLEVKYAQLRESLKCGPAPMSVTAWYQDSMGNYIKPVGARDNHLVLCVYLDENDCPWIWDTYSPFLKKLTPKYNSDFAMRWSIEKKTQQMTWWQKFINWLSKLI